MAYTQVVKKFRSIASSLLCNTCFTFHINYSATQLQGSHNCYIIIAMIVHPQTTVSDDFYLTIPTQLQLCVYIKQQFRLLGMLTLSPFLEVTPEFVLLLQIVRQVNKIMQSKVSVNSNVVQNSGFMKAASLNMRDSSQYCPATWREYTKSGVRDCG